MINKPVSFAELNSHETLPPYRTSAGGGNWQAIPHKDLVSCVMDVLSRKESWFTYDPIIMLSKDKRDITLTVPMHPKASSQDYSLLLGFVGSNSGQKRIKMYAGVGTERENVWLMQLPFSIKHLKSIELSEAIDCAVNKVFMPMSKRIPHEVGLLKQEEISKGDAERVLMQAGRDRLIPWTRIGVADHLFSKSECTQWNLLCAFAFATKVSPANQQMDKIVKFKRMLP